MSFPSILTWGSLSCFRCLYWKKPSHMLKGRRLRELCSYWGLIWEHAYSFLRAIPNPLMTTPPLNPIHILQLSAEAQTIVIGNQSASEVDKPKFNIQSPPPSFCPSQLPFTLGRHMLLPVSRLRLFKCTPYLIQHYLQYPGDESNLYVHSQINGWDVVHIYNRILPGHKKEWNWVIGSDVDEPRVC